ncbi:sugar kinase [Oricola cellulosilytica]|uniref:Sugar kinase n=1 Tax=Oricola cellulosilytica TaxID=1429082 RepID=A0A4R0PC07_9HYPH|nr:sugar kinase [Oricola cellulosilytica]TCD14991.1 sugar kinase [Oricola cellulosilytica]
MLHRIVSIGECMIELSGKSDDGWRQGFAGDTFNTLWYLRALSSPETSTDYVSAFGDDPFSRQQIEFLDRNRIGIAESPIIEGKTPGLYAITLDAAGERSFTYWRNDAAARMLADDPKRLTQSLSGASLIYFSGITLAILADAARETLLSAISDARDENASIAFDPNYRPRLWPRPEAARTAIRQGYWTASIVLPTFDDERALFGDKTPGETLERIIAEGPGEIVVKSGGEAALVYHGGEGVEVAPPESVEPIDTTGAGDSFNGAYLAGRLAGMTAEAAALYAHKIAGKVIRHHGALLPMKSLAILRP